MALTDDDKAITAELLLDLIMPTATRCRRFIRSLKKWVLQLPTVVFTRKIERRGKKTKNKDYANHEQRYYNPAVTHIDLSIRCLREIIPNGTLSQKNAIDQKYLGELSWLFM